MDYIVLSEDEMKEQFQGKEKDNELIEYIMKGELIREEVLNKPFIVKKMELQGVENNRAAEDKEEPVEIADLPDLMVTDSLVTKGFNFKKRKDGILIFPYFNEREDLFYIDDFQGVDMIPPKGFFWLIDTDVTNKPFGVYTTETFIAEVTRKFNDFRYENVIKKRSNPREGKVYVDEKYFYFDYQTEEYVQVNVKFDKEGNPDNEETAEWVKRKTAIDYIFYRFSRILRNYWVEYNKFYKTFIVLISNITESEKYIATFKAYEKFLELAKNKFPIKLFLGHVDSFEFKVITDEIDKHLILVIEMKEMVETIQKNEKCNVIFNDDRWSTKYKKEYEVLGSSSTLGFLKTIYDFITKRKEVEKSSNTVSTDGYIVVKDEKGVVTRLVPNLGTVESRNFFTEYQSSADKIKEMERKIMDTFNKNLEPVESRTENQTVNIPILVQAFTEEELEELMGYYEIGGDLSIKDKSIIKMKELKISPSELRIHIDSLYEYFSKKKPE